MGYDFTPINEDCDDFSMGAFSWPALLRGPVGIALCIGPWIDDINQIMGGRDDGLDPLCNDGAMILDGEAKNLALLTRLFCDYQDVFFEEFEKLSEEERKNAKNAPIRRDFIEKYRAFADFAEKSGGFTVG
jgi:hypothetical protein